MKPIKDIKEITDSGSSGSYDVPAFGTNRKDPLAIDGEKSIKKSRAVIDRKFPKFGGPEGIYVKIKEKCKKFPYCNSGDSVELLEIKNSILEISKETKIPVNDIKEIVINKLNQIFI